MAIVDESVGVVSSTGKVASKGAGLFLPFGKINLWTTIFVFSFLIIQGSVLSVQQHSLFPLISNTLFSVVASDSKISSLVDDFAQSTTPKPDSWFKYPFSKYFWEKILWGLNILGCLWFLYFFFLIIFSLMKMLNSTSVFVALILSFIIFVFVSGYANLLLFNASQAGMVRDVNPLNVIKSDLGHSVPFSGVVKLVRFFADKGYAQWLVDNPVVKVFSNVPDAFNVTNNVSGVV